MTTPQREALAEIRPQESNTPGHDNHLGKCKNSSESRELIPRLVSKIADLEQKLYAGELWGGACAYTTAVHSEFEPTLMPICAFPASSSCSHALWEGC